MILLFFSYFLFFYRIMINNGICIAVLVEFQTFEITEKSQILRKGIRTHVHGRPVVIVYTSMCTFIVLLTWKTFRINIEITSGLRHRFAWPKLYFHLASQLTWVMKFKPRPRIVNCLKIWDAIKVSNTNLN